MALTNQQLGMVVDRIRMMDQLLNLTLRVDSLLRDATVSLDQKAVARSFVTIMKRAMQATIQDPIVDPGPAYTEAELATVEQGFSMVHEILEAMQRNIAFLQQGVLVRDESGNVIRDFTQVQKDTIESELRRQYGKLTTVLGLIP